MCLELTAEQTAFRASVEQFVRDEVYPRATEIDACADFGMERARLCQQRPRRRDGCARQRDAGRHPGSEQSVVAATRHASMCFAIVCSWTFDVPS